jgi:hypothetical protein
VAWSLLNFKQVVLDDQQWTPVTFDGSRGLLFKSWIKYAADVKLRTDANDASTEILLEVAKGDEFVMDIGVPLTIESGQLLVYAQSALGPQTITLSYFFQRGREA